MTNDPRDQRIKRILENIDTAIPATDPHAERAVEAVRRSTPTHVITALEKKGLLSDMLSKMTTRFEGRALKTISTTELIQIARDSVDETMGIEPLQRSNQEFPEPQVSDLTPEGQALHEMRQIAEVVERWNHGTVVPLEAAAEIEEIVQGKWISAH